MTPLEPCEHLLDNGDELWFRQAKRHWVDEGRVDIHIFRTGSIDQGKLSGVRALTLSPEDAYKEHEKTKPGDSVGTWAVSVGEAKTIGLRCIDDSACPSEPPPPTGHTYIDFRDIPKPDVRELREKLVLVANQRGCLYKPSASHT